MTDKGTENLLALAMSEARKVAVYEMENTSLRSAVQKISEAMGEIRKECDNVVHGYLNRVKTTGSDAPCEKRFCALCQHFGIIEGQRDWSDVTPGNDFEMTCGKDHWKFDPFNTSETEYAKMMLTATKCQDYVERKLLD
jgi:hypothetical protein